MRLQREDTPIDRLKAPEQDKQTLIWPSAQEMRDMAEQNRISRQTVTLLDRPSSEWCQDRSSDRLMILCGHQPDFFHPGVWAKQVVACALARACGGNAQFLVVDSDVPGTLRITWPESRASSPYAQRESSARATGMRSFEQIDEASRLDLAAMTQAALPHVSQDSPLDAFASAFSENQTNYVSHWEQGIAAVDRLIGVETPAFVHVSERFSFEVPSGRQITAAFVAHLLLQAKEFGAVYNAALARYRARRGMSGHQHPIPDLGLDGNHETPFWHLQAGRPRQRLWVQAMGDDLHVYAENTRLGTLGRRTLIDDPARALRTLPGSIRPRALAQTLYARLFESDLFIHGIGGAKYDQITDDIIQSFFGITPPRYACVSATLRLPLDLTGVTPGDLRAARHRARDVWYNPQRYVGDGGDPGQFERLMENKSNWIQTSEQLRVKHPGNKAARRRAYFRIREANQVILKTAPQLTAEFASEVKRVRACLESDRVAKSREWFYAIHEKPRLRQLADTLSAGF